jgi:hypothetical protein
MATTRTKLTGSVQAATISELDGATYRALKYRIACSRLAIRSR